MTDGTSTSIRGVHGDKDCGNPAEFAGMGMNVAGMDLTVARFSHGYILWMHT